MPHVKSGHMAASGEWRKHLRKLYKRAFWKRHRIVESVAAKREAGDRANGSVTGTRLGRGGLIPARL